MRHPILVTLFFVIVAAFASGCSGDSEDCPDCGGCGIAGPVENPGRDIYIAAKGVDTDGVAAVDLALQAGECKSQDSIEFRLLWSGSAATVQPRGSLGELDASKVTFDNGVSTWTDRSLTMSFERSGTDVLITFSEGAAVVTTKCSGADRMVTCTAQ